MNSNLQCEQAKGMKGTQMECAEAGGPIIETHAVRKQRHLLDQLFNKWFQPMGLFLSIDVSICVSAEKVS